MRRRQEAFFLAWLGQDISVDGLDASVAVIGPIASATAAKLVDGGSHGRQSADLIRWLVVSDSRAVIPAAVGGGSDSEARTSWK